MQLAMLGSKILRRTESEDHIPSLSVAQGYHNQRVMSSATNDTSECPTKGPDNIAGVSENASHSSRGDDTEISQSKTHMSGASNEGTQAIDIAPLDTMRPDTSPGVATSEQQVSPRVGSAPDAGCPSRNTQPVHPSQASPPSSGLIGRSALNDNESGPENVLLPPQSVRLARAVREDSNETEILQWLEKRDHAPGFEDKEDTCKVMEELDVRGFICVDSLLEDMKIPHRQPVRLDPDIYYPTELLELLATLMGCSTGDAIARFIDLSNTEHQKHIELYAIIRALLASAVKHWCLEPSPQVEDFFEVPHM